MDFQDDHKFGAPAPTRATGMMSMDVHVTKFALGLASSESSLKAK